jgi:hypothetical protein
VGENAGRIHVRKAEQLLDSIAAPTVGETDAKSDGGCGCEDAEADRTDRAAECKPPIAELFASAENGEGAGAAAMIAHCRELFGGLFGEHIGPAKTTEAPTATAAKGCSGKKEV